MIKTKKGLSVFHSKKPVNILGYLFNPTGKPQESLEERMQKDHKAW